MDPFSLIVSIITVVDATSKLSKHVCTLSHKIHHSPEELADISWHIAVYRSNLGALGALESLGDRFSSQDIRLHVNSLKSLAKDTQVLLDEIENKISLMFDANKVVKMRKRLIWALKDEKIVHGLLQKLEAIEYHIRALLSVISISVSCLLSERFEAVEERLNKLLADRHPKSPACKHLDGNQEITPIFSRKPWVLKASKPADGSFGNYIRFSRVLKTRQSAWILSTLMRLPFQRLLALAISIHWEYMLPTRCSLVFDIKNIVPSNSPFMTACANGDYEYASRLLRNSHVTCSPMDIDETGEPVLYKAVKSGSTALVELLLNEGASANAIEEKFHGSALGLACQSGLVDIVRLLMSHGACVHHVDSFGVSILAKIWQRPSITFPRNDLAKAIFAVSIPQIDDPQSRPAMSLINCIAMNGSAQDIELAVKYGACTRQQDVHGNYPLNYSILNHNVETYDILKASVPFDWVHARNRQGSTPLHITLSVPGLAVAEIVERLIQDGSNIYLADEKGMHPEDIAKSTDEKWGNIQIPKIFRSNNLSSYVEALRRCGHDVEIHGDGELYWFC